MRASELNKWIKKIYKQEMKYLMRAKKKQIYKYVNEQTQQEGIKHNNVSLLKDSEKIVHTNSKQKTQ